MKKIVFLFLLVLLFSSSFGFAKIPDSFFDDYLVLDIEPSEDNEWYFLYSIRKHDWTEHVYAIKTDLTNLCNPIWNDQGQGLMNIVYSKANDCFYFYFAWNFFSDNPPKSDVKAGLYCATKDIDGIYSRHYVKTYMPQNSNLGYLVKNDYGIYLVKMEYSADGEVCYFYQVEDKNGNVKCKIPSALHNIKLAHFKLEDRKVASNIAKPTKEGFILQGENKKIFYYYNCKTNSLKYFLQQDDAYLYAQEVESKKNNNSYILLFLLVVFCFAGLTVIICLLINKYSQNIKSINKKQLNQFIFDIQEKERSKISRDIHDSVIQDIRVIRLETEMLSVMPESKETRLKIENVATECITKLRNICYNLTPAEIAIYDESDSAKYELVSIIDSLVKQVSANTHLPCSVKIAQDFVFPVLSKEVIQNLFRVVQEAFTNIEKHSFATQASVFMKTENEKLIIYITDDGIGCTQQQISQAMKSKEHFGLRSMKERVDLIGGNIEFLSDRDNGMEVKIQIKYK